MSGNSGKSAVIDIGSNSIKLLIGEQSGGCLNVIESLKNAVPLGIDSFYKGRISKEITNQTIGILGKYKEKLSEYGIESTQVIATTAVREAQNKDIFVNTIYRKTGLQIETLTAGDVVYYIVAYLYNKLKDKYPVHDKNLLIVELGSGSLDVSVLEKGFISTNMDLPIGTLRLKRMSGRMEGSFEELYEVWSDYLKNEISNVKRAVLHINIDDIIVIDENYSSFFGNILKSNHKEEFFSITKSDSEELLNALKENSPEQISDRYKIPFEFSDTIGAFGHILKALFGVFATDKLYMFQALLSEAVLANKLLDYELSSKYNKANQLASAAKYLCAKFSADMPHINIVVELSEQLFAALREELGLKRPDWIYLMLAAYMHDLGMFVHNRSHHKHSEYLINSFDLFRLSEEERAIVACIARYHRKGIPSAGHLLYKTLSNEKQILVQKLSSILRIANALDASHMQKIKRLEAGFTKKKEIVVNAFTRENVIIERDDFNDKKYLFEEITGNTIKLKVSAGE